MAFPTIVRRVAVLVGFRPAFWAVHIEYHDAGGRTGNFACAVNSKPRPPKTPSFRRLVSDREGPPLLL